MTFYAGAVRYRLIRNYEAPQKDVKRLFVDGCSKAPTM